MKTWCYRWLPILCGCHCRDDRSFHWKGERFPVCARCTGELLGIALGFVTFFWWQTPPLLCLGLMVPMVADGFCQMLTAYESTNWRRLVTGGLFGYALYTLFAHSSVWVFLLGYHLGDAMK